MIHLRKLCSDVDLRAAPIASLANALTYPTEMGIQLCLCIAGVALSNSIPLVPEVLICALQEGRDQIILCAEVTVETGFCDACLLDHKVDSDSANALLVEKF